MQYERTYTITKNPSNGYKQLTIRFPKLGNRRRRRAMSFFTNGDLPLWHALKIGESIRPHMVHNKPLFEQLTAHVHENGTDYQRSLFSKED